MNAHFTLAINPARARSISTEILIWNEITILLSYEPDWLNLSAAGFDSPFAHLELQVLEPRGAPIPLSDTGYWSDYPATAAIDEAGGARSAVTALLDEMSHSQSWRANWARWEQRDLFG